MTRLSPLRPPSTASPSLRVIAELPKPTVHSRSTLSSSTDIASRQAGNRSGLVVTERSHGFYGLTANTRATVPRKMRLRSSGLCEGRSLKPSAQPTLVRTQHLPPRKTAGHSWFKGRCGCSKRKRCFKPSLNGRFCRIRWSASRTGLPGMAGRRRVRRIRGEISGSCVSVFGPVLEPEMEIGRASRPPMEETVNVDLAGTGVRLPGFIFVEQRDLRLCLRAVALARDKAPPLGLWWRCAASGPRQRSPSRGPGQARPALAALAGSG